MNRFKKLILLILPFCLIFTFCIGIFAVNSIESDYSIPPSDLGTELNSLYNATGYTKYYIRINISEINETSTIYIRQFINDESTNFSNSIITITFNSNYLVTAITRYYETDYSIFVVPIVKFEITNSLYIYLPVYVYNGALLVYDSLPLSDGITYYISSTQDQNTINREAFNIGYENGYYNGYNQGLLDYPGDLSALNLYQHIERAMKFFVGDDLAEWITPFALSFTVFLAYCIFIRWLLMFGKSQKALKVADIIVSVACICIMAVLYINKLTINISSTQITESVYQIAQDVNIGG